MHRSISLPFIWIIVYIFCFLSNVQSAPINPPHESPPPLSAPVESTGKPSPQLYVIQHDINSKASHGCTKQQMAYLDRTVGEALLLVQSSLKLLSKRDELLRSLAWTYMGDARPDAIKEDYFERLVKPLSQRPKRIKEPLKVTRETKDESITFVCPGPSTSIASNLDAQPGTEPGTYTQGHVMYLYDYFFNRETTPTLKAVLAQISRGELPRCAASMVLVHEFMHNLAILLYPFDRLEDLTDNHGQSVYGAHMVQKLPAHLRYKTADAPMMFAIYARHWDLAHPAERLAAQCPLEASSPEGHTAQGASPGDKVTSGAHDTKETKEAEEWTGWKGRGGRKGATGGKVGGKGGTGGKAAGKGKNEKPKHDTSEDEEEGGVKLTARTNPPSKGAKCEPRWPTINWAQIVMSSP